MSEIKSQTTDPWANPATQSEIERLIEARKFLATVPKEAKVEINYNFNQFQMIIELHYRLKAIEAKLKDKKS